MNLTWTKCQGNVWCKLNFVDLDHPHFTGKRGVYIIWHGGSDSKAVYVGKGNIRERLLRHRTDENIQQYDYLDLYVTWAEVPESEIDGVEAHLISVWQPKANMQDPTAAHVPVNSPWE